MDRICTQKGYSNIYTTKYSCPGLVTGVEVLPLAQELLSHELPRLAHIRVVFVEEQAVVEDENHIVVELGLILVTGTDRRQVG